MRDVSRLLLSIAAVLLGVAAVIASIKIGMRDASAVSTEQNALPVSGAVYTQSADGTRLYVWEWKKDEKRWGYFTHDKTYR
jgi:hypothetical protein